MTLIETLGKTQADAALSSGILHMDGGRYSDALSEFQKASAIDPISKQVSANMAKAQKAWEIEKSLRPNERLPLQKTEDLLTALTPPRMLTLVLDRGFFCVPSQADIERWQQLAPDNQLLISTLKSKALENKTRLEQAIAEFSSFADEGMYQQATEKLESAKSICPTNSFVTTGLDEARNAQKLEAALQAGPLELVTIERLLKGRVRSRRAATLVSERGVSFNLFTLDDEKRLRAAGARDEVIVAIKGKLPVNSPSAPGSGEVKLVTMGNEMRRTKKYQEALDYADRALKINARYDKAWELRGDALQGLQRFPEALKSFDKAVEFNPIGALAWSKRGLVLQDMKEHSEALRSFDRSLNINPMDPVTWIFKGDSLRATKHCNEAKNSYDKALELDPSKQLTLEERYQALTAC